VSPDRRGPMYSPFRMSRSIVTERLLRLQAKTPLGHPQEQSDSAARRGVHQDSEDDGWETCKTLRRLKLNQEMNEEGMKVDCD